MPRKGGVKENLKPFVKGEDPRRNKNGAPKLPDLNAAISAVLGDKKEDRTALDAILMKWRQMALNGHVRAGELLMQYGYGLPKQKLELSGNPDAPINLVLDERYKDDTGLSP